MKMQGLALGAMLTLLALLPLALTTPVTSERLAPLVLRSARAGAVAAEVGLKVSPIPLSISTNFRTHAHESASFPEYLFLGMQLIEVTLMICHLLKRVLIKMACFFLPPPSRTAQ